MAKEKRSVFAIICFILALLSLVVMPFTWGLLTVWIAPISIIFGIISLVLIKKKKQSGKGLAISGIVISVIAIFLSLLLFSVIAAFAWG